MPRAVSYTPKYRKHKQSGQAIVSLSGKDFLLGPHGTKASHLEYDRLVGEWIANGRQLKPDGRFTVVELVQAYWQFAQG